jgi:hypothetical protein
MRCAVPHHATPANMGCAFHVFLTTTTTTLVVANLRLGDWNESWSPRTEQNTATKLQQNIESGGTTFFVCFLHIVTFILVDILVFLLTSYIHCVSVYCIFLLHSFFPLPWLVSALNKLCYNASNCVCTRAIFLHLVKKVLLHSSSKTVGLSSSFVFFCL